MWKDNKKCVVLLGFDFDAESLWGGDKFNTPTYQSRGAYGARVGVPRILSLLEKYNLPATFFVPGVVAEKHSDVVKEIHDRGHEIAHHGYLHVSPSRMELEEEKTALDKGIAALENITGKRPLGYRSPSWDLSQNSIQLFHENGFLYDSSMMADDFHFYALPFEGKSSDLVEIPVSWELDDAPHFLFNFSPLRVGLSAPSKVYEIWSAEFDGAYASGGAFTLTMHPQVMGRYHRILILEQLIQYILGHPDVWFTTCATAAKDWLQRQ